MQSEGRLYLVFEFVDRDLKKYMEAQPDMLPRAQVKVSACAHRLALYPR